MTLGDTLSASMGGSMSPPWLKRGDPYGRVFLADAATGLLASGFTYARSGPDLWCPQADGSLASFAANVIPREYAGGRWGFRFDPGFVNSCLWGDEQTVARGWLSDTSPVVGEDSLTPPMFGGTYTKHTSTGSVAPKVYRSATVTPGQIVTMSALVRLGTMPAASFAMAFFDETAGGFISTQIVPATAPNSSGWTRVDATITVPAGCTSLRFYPFRNGSAHTGGTFYIAAVNLTNTAYPVPLTVAQGTAGTVGNHSCSALLSALGISLGSKHCLGVEYIPLALTQATATALRLDDGTDATRAQLARTNNSYNTVALSRVASVTQYQTSLAATQGALNRAAMRLEGNNTRAATNGLLMAADDGVAMVPTVSRITIGHGVSAGVEPIAASIASAYLIPTRALTDTELQAVTT